VTLRRNILYYGSESPPPESVSLRAGPLSLSFVAGEIRYIRLGSREILRRVYVAVRDRNWRTVPSSLLEFTKTVDRESFELHFEVENKKDEIDFCWQGCVTGHSNGSIVFTMEGCARSAFWQNRIGFCVLHPSVEWAGASCLIETVDGDHVAGEFPLHISPGTVFSKIRAISHEVFPGIRADLRLEGSHYEMEDQRNWSDASYKTYCPPLKLPFPSEIEAGSTFSQAVTLTFKGDTSGVSAPVADGPVVIRMGERNGALPRIGLAIPSAGGPLRNRSVDRLRALHLSHLRVNLKLFDAGYQIQLERATESAFSLGVALEVALFLSDDAQEEIDTLRAVLDRIRPVVGAWLVFHIAEKSTKRKWLDMARSSLSDYEPAARFGGGTDANFAELNRSRPPLFGIDMVSYSLNPQVHLSDDANLIENLSVQESMVESARQFIRDVPLAVSPVTLKPRFNTDATSIERPVAEGELPRPVDPRQMSLLGAVWTLGCLRNLAESHIYSTTFYETVGWGGVMETEEGALLPAKFPSSAGSVFPLYHVFADVGEFQGGLVVNCASSNPLKALGFAVSKNGGLRIMLANLTAEAQTVRLQTNSRAGIFQAKVLDEGTAEWAMNSPEEYRAAGGETIELEEKGTEVQLPPLAMMRLDRV